MRANTSGPDRDRIRVSIATVYYSSELQVHILVQCEPESLNQDLDIKS